MKVLNPFAQVGEQFEHGLIHHLGVKPLGLGMLRGGEPVFDDLLELLGGHASVRGHDDFQHRSLAATEHALDVALEKRGERLLFLPLGMLGRDAFTRSSAKNSWKYIGCSAQSVPSLSKTAMRSAGGTKSGELFFVTFETNSTIVVFAGPSFHDGSGSDSARTGVTTYHGAQMTAASTHLLMLCRLMAIHPHGGHLESLMQEGLVYTCP